jgi:uncharacterized protein YdhG (YjbR/CyaY superfamily)
MTARTSAKRSPVDEYIAAAPKHARTAIALVRRTIRTALPDAQETISYKMPAYRVHGRIAVYFAAWSEHYALYPGNADLVARFRTALAPYEIAKGTIRFGYHRPVPTKLISSIARFRMQQIGKAMRLVPTRNTVSRRLASRTRPPTRPRRRR